MQFVRFVLRPFICLGAPDSSLLLGRIRRSSFEGYRARTESDRMERLRGCTHPRMAADSELDLKLARLSVMEGLAERRWGPEFQVVAM